MRHTNDDKPVKRYVMNWAKFIDLLIGVGFLTMALYMFLNWDLTGGSIMMVLTYSLVGLVFIARRTFNSRK
jgi:hypothetical protein